MSNPLVQAVIRTKFLMTSREKASQIIRGNADAYLKLAERIGNESGERSISIPPMIGVDPEMRAWSFFQILEHNVIVNGMIAHTVEKLARGEDPNPERAINHKTDVLPGDSSGAEQIAAFSESIKSYLSMVTTLPLMRGTAKTQHPVFGPFDAHKWHCMFGFHLGLHLKQAEKVIALLNA